MKNNLKQLYRKGYILHTTGSLLVTTIVNSSTKPAKRPWEPWESLEENNQINTVFL